MKLIWDIKTTPSSTNSNEKSAGTVFTDDRLYGKIVFQVGIANQFLTPQLFTKPTDSNTLTLGNSYEAYDGDTMTIETLCSNNY